MNQLQLNFNLPLTQGTFKGVNWRSLTPIGQAQSELLYKLLQNHNANRRAFGLDEVGVAEMLQAKYQMTLAQWCTKKFTRLTYYKSKSRYFNNHGLEKI